ncbi:MAG: hypothetical protein JST00_01600 [Deltaproteobacteria bacterium]|nr:hypothetical protein [Deltaproteobacteria bacterium]
MAIDNTPPRLRLIVTIAIIVVITLFGLDFVFKSYYAHMLDEAQHEKLAPTRDRDESRASEQTSLTSGKVPIEQAMAQIAKGTRDSVIEPRQSDDTGSMSGWSKMPKPTPQPIVQGAPLDPQGAADGGAAMTGDAGAPVGDGGVNAEAGAPHAEAGAPAPKPGPAPAPHH